MTHLTTVATPSLYIRDAQSVPTVKHIIIKGVKILTVVSGLTGRLRVMGVPPSFTIFAFFLCRRRS